MGYLGNGMMKEWGWGVCRTRISATSYN